MIRQGTKYVWSTFNCISITLFTTKLIFAVQQNYQEFAFIETVTVTQIVQEQLCNRFIDEITSNGLNYTQEYNNSTCNSSFMLTQIRIWKKRNMRTELMSYECACIQRCSQ